MLNSVAVCCSVLQFAGPDVVSALFQSAWLYMDVYSCVCTCVCVCVCVSECVCMCE